MNLKDIQFTQQALNVNTEVIAENEAILTPNPMSYNADLSFYAETNAVTKIEVYNVTGALVKNMEENTTIGNNKVSLLREGLKSGVYFIKIRNDFRNYKTIKLVVN
ncbi:T9SS type A sorting domain-containing protein [Polaribacter atrinae]|uniref:T9SS type A sorting domain-containing protein n=1 Tax=Polaribacter atrinae TaxID=1333662 RepID=UPI0024928C3B|nr:T9SS type A sorting domain-containing protein [Polaribacter atrinae]